MLFLKPFLGRIKRFFLSLASEVRHPTLAERLVLTGILVGMAAGFASFVFTHLIDRMTRLTIAIIPQGTSTWHYLGFLFFPALGVFLGYILIHFFCPEAQGHGTEVLEILPESSRFLAARVAMIKLLASATTIGFGGSAGQEGPIIQIGGATGSWLGKQLRVPQEDIKVLIAAGAAAGLGAAFGAPLAAVFFIMEVVLKDFASSLFSSIVIAAVSGAVTSRLLMGDVDFVLGATYTWHRPSDLLVYALVGFMCAPLGLVYKVALEKVEKYTEQKKAAFPWYFFPIAGGLLVGVIALGYPEIMGTGRKFVDRAFLGEISGWRIGVMALAKILATALTLGAGGSGGAFMPVVFIGATAGAFLSGIFGRLLATATLARGSFAIVGMSSVITSSYRAPITAIIMALEMSRDYGIVLPVMVACAISLVTSLAV